MYTAAAITDTANWSLSDQTDRRTENYQCITLSVLCCSAMYTAAAITDTANWSLSDQTDRRTENYQCITLSVLCCSAMYTAAAITDTASWSLSDRTFLKACLCRESCKESVKKNLYMAWSKHWLETANPVKSYFYSKSPISNHLIICRTIKSCRILSMMMQILFYTGLAFFTTFQQNPMSV